MRKLKQKQFLPLDLETAWNFFSNPKNLNEITPPGLVFEITSELPEKIYKGLIITYKIRPMLNIPVNWRTEITEVKEQQLFIDEQQSGPYSTWRHEHHFKEVEGGVLMTDIVYYSIGKSVLGWLAGKLFVHKQVRDIFRYRRNILKQLFKA